MRLSAVESGREVVVMDVEGGGPVCAQRLGELGFYSGAHVQVMRGRGYVPLMVRLGQTRLALDPRYAAAIRVTPVGEAAEGRAPKRRLTQCDAGESGRIAAIRCGDAPVVQRLTDMGLTEGAHVRLLRAGDKGQPLEVEIGNGNAMIHPDDARYLEIATS